MENRLQRLSIITTSTTAGLLAILLNLPLLVVILATLAAGIVTMIHSGSIKIRRGEKPERGAGEGRLSRLIARIPRPGWRKGGKEKGSASDLSGSAGPAGGLFRSVPGYIRSFGAAMKEAVISGLHFRRTEDTREIDRALDGVVTPSDEGGAENPAEIEEIGEVAGISDDPLAELDSIDLDGVGDELDLPEMDTVAGQAADGSAISPAPEGDVPDNSAVENILAAYADELGDDVGLPEIEVADEPPDDLTLDSLDEIDVDEEIVIEGDGSSEKEEIEQIADKLGVEELTYEEYEEEEEEEGGEEDESKNIISFATGETEDEMISLLKSEVGVKKKKIDTSLVRELKDTRISAEELKAELEEVLTLLSHGGAGG
ncbi:MAG: hypothetical protein ACXQTN_06365 [Methanoculleaceae archaeon]